MLSARSHQRHLELVLFTFALLPLARAQGIQFVNVPETVTEGTEGLIVSWTGGSPGVVCDFLPAHQYVADIGSRGSCNLYRMDE